MKYVYAVFFAFTCLLVIPQKIVARFVFLSQDAGFNIVTGRIDCQVSRSTYTGKMINQRYPGSGTYAPYSAQGDYYFQNGIYSDGIYEMIYTGTYSSLPPAGRLGCEFLMAGGGSANFTVQAPMRERICVTGSGNNLKGQPLFVATNAVTLANPSADLTINIQSELNKSIIMNGGTIILDADLPLKDDVKLTGSGMINFNQHNLVFGTAELVWTDTVLMLNAENIELNAACSVRTQWHFKNDAHIVGNNFLLDLTNGGSLFIKPNTTLRMSNLTLKGLGSGSIIFEDKTSQLELFGVIIDIDKNVTFTLGNVYISGDSTVITRDKFLTFDATSSLTVDRSTLLYDTLSYNDQNNVQFTSLTSNYASLNGGSVKKVRALPVGDFIVSADTILDRSLIVSPLKKLRIEDNATIDGAGFAYQFALEPGEDIFFVSAGKKAQFQNILMQDVPTEYVSLGAASQLVFGPNATVALGASGTLTNTWYFSGKTVLNGNNNILDFGTNGHLVLRPGSSILLNNITLRSIKGNDAWGSIICMDNKCTVSFGNVTWVQDADYSFTQGKFTVNGYWDLQGTSTFNYATNKQSLITSFGTLEIDKDFTFHYMPSSDNRDLIAMESSDAIMNLNGGTLSSTTTGIRLTKGTLMVPELGTLYSHGAVAQSEAITFGNNNLADDLTVRIEGNLQLVAGRWLYDNVEQ